MSKPFKGKVNVDIRDSVPDWSPFEPPKAPDGAPSVVYIVLDDVGFSAMSCYGGPIATPNIDRIAGDGVRYTQWHTTALCSPTRSCLLTGRNHTRNSMACITEAASGFPNASGMIPPENGKIPEILGEQGWNTYMVGKWHLCPDGGDEPRLDAAQLADRAAASSAATGSSAPRPTSGIPTWSTTTIRSTSRGRPRRATTSARTSPTRRSSSSRTPRRSRRRSRSSSTTRRARATPRTTRPRSGSTGSRASSTWATRRCASRRWPARRRWASSRPTPSCRRSTRSARPRPAPGPDGQPFPALDVTRPWDSLSADEKRLFAGWPRSTPASSPTPTPQIGRLLDYLEETGQRENTLVIVVSDNGASGEGGPNGSVNEMKFANGIPDDIERQPRDARRAGRPEDLQPLPERLGDGVQHAVQDVEALRVQRRHLRPVHHLLAGRHRGQGRDPRAVPPRHRPRADHPRRARRRAARGDQRAHPEPLRRRQHALQLRRRGAPSARETQFYSMLGSRGIWHDGWKAVTTHPTLSGWSNFNDDEWELYHIDVDRSELHDLAAEQPEKLRELVNLWYAEAGANGAFPLDDRSRAGDPHHAAAAALAAAQPLHLLPRRRRRARVAGGQRPQPLVRDRRAGRHPRAPGAEGVLFAHGSRFGGHALYVKDNRLHYVYSFVGMVEQKIVADRGPADRRAPDPVRLVREGRRGPARRRRPACCRSTTATSRSARAGSRPSPAST